MRVAEPSGHLKRVVELSAHFKRVAELMIHFVANGQTMKWWRTYAFVLDVQLVRIILSLDWNWFDVMCPISEP
jgi:hypothetical protein